MNFPRISIITTSYNQAEFLEACIDSVLRQNYPDLEYIIMDGGSSDKSVDIIKKYEKYLKYWQSWPDGGQYRAIDDGFKKFSGDIMAWLNSDDKYHKKSFFKVVYIFQEFSHVKWLTGRPTVWNKNGRLDKVFSELPKWERKKYLDHFFKQQCIQQESTFFKRDLWTKVGGYIESTLKYAGDLELWVRFFRHERLYTADLLIAGFRIHPKQKTGYCMEQYIEEGVHVINHEKIFIKKGQYKNCYHAPDIISFDEEESKKFKKCMKPFL